MVENYLIYASGLFMEVIHIQLSLEWIEILVLVVFGKDLLFEHFSALDLKSFAFIDPINYVFQLIILTNFK